MAMLFPKWLSRSILHAAKSAATAMVIAGGLAVWASLRIYAEATQLGLPVAMAGGVLVFAAIVVAWNALQQIDDRHNRVKLANRSPAEIERWIWDWLRASRYTAQNRPEPHLDFQIEVTSETGQKFCIFKRKDRQWVGIQASRSPHPSDAAAVSMQSDASGPFRTELTIALAQLGVGHKIDHQGVAVTRPLTFDESITELSFLQDVSLVVRALNIVDGLWSRYERSKLPPSSDA